MDLEQIRALTRMPPHLVRYWTAGEGGLKIKWGVPGDFDRCRRHIQEAIVKHEAPLSPHMIDGLCATLHKIATGATPGHAPGESHGHKGHGHRSDGKKPYGDVTYADPGHQKDSKKRYPIDTAEHAKAAWSYINQASNAAKYSPEQLSSIKGRIKAALKRFGVNVSEDEKSSRTDTPTPFDVFATHPFTRSYPLEDISIRSGGDGRTVEAYAAVFDTETEIMDQDGHYREVLDRTVFNRAISDSAPQGGRQGWRVGVFYNHGMTLLGTPSDRHSMPVGVPVEIKVEPRGLLTVTRYNRSALSDEILENIRDGGINGYSFSGAFKRSTPVRPRGGFRSDSAGNLQTVRRMESTLREYGPTPFPAYQEAAIVGMRAMQQFGYTPDQAMQIIAGLASDAPVADSSEPSAADYAALATGDSPPQSQPQSRQELEAERSSRSVKGQMRANRSAWLQRYGGSYTDEQI